MMDASGSNWSGKKQNGDFSALTSAAVLKSKDTGAREVEPQPEIIDLAGEHEACETLRQQDVRIPMVGPRQLEHEGRQVRWGCPKASSRLLRECVPRPLERSSIGVVTYRGILSQMPGERLLEGA